MAGEGGKKKKKKKKVFCVLGSKELLELLGGEERRS